MAFNNPDTSTTYRNETFYSDKYTLDNFDSETVNLLEDITDEIYPIQNNMSRLILGGRTASLITLAYLNKNQLGLQTFDMFISDYDVYLESNAVDYHCIPDDRLIRHSPHAVDFKWAGSHHLQAIYKIPAEQILKSPAEKLIQYCCDPKFITATMQNYHSFNSKINTLENSILNTYDMNATQALCIFDTEWVELYYTREFLEFSKDNILRLTQRQKAWFQMYLAAPSSESHQVLSKLATHLMIVASRFNKYLTTHPSNPEAEENSLTLIRSTLEMIKNRDLRPVKRTPSGLLPDSGTSSYLSSIPQDLLTSFNIKVQKKSTLRDSDIPWN